MLLSEISILVVDDVNAVRAQVKQLLKEVGFRNVVLASSGAEAKGVMEETPFHLILADWYMEPIDGLELLKHTREHAKYAKVPFIMVTAESTREKVVHAIKSGVDDYLVKPLTPAQIQTKVVGLLLKRGII
jgi:two-component system chemotaxis response regulator CheY